jgi:hypothetical protein
MFYVNPAPRRCPFCISPGPALRPAGPGQAIVLCCAMSPHAVPIKSKSSPAPPRTGITPKRKPRQQLLPGSTLMERKNQDQKLR